MGKKKEENGQEPVYKTDSGEEIKYYTESLYDHVVGYFSQMESFLDVLEMVDFGKIPNKSIEGFQLFFADMGRTLIKDLERKYTAIYDLIAKEVGDIRIDSANDQLGIEAEAPLGAYIKAGAGAKG